ncbi:MAG: hypothetical protein N2258_08240 [Brevinematales bacterium]|nr:hypothetical protein [Brevinematales bacterium]
MTTHIKILLIFFAVSQIFALNFPENDFFPVGSDIKYTLVSEKSNSIELSQRLILPENWEDYGIWIVWIIKYNNINEINLIFWANYEREVYLSAIKDNFYERMLTENILIFSPVINFNKDIKIGENIYFSFLKDYNEFTHPITKVKLSQVIKAKLKLNKIEYFLYFIKKRGIAIIETKDEVFTEIKVKK